LTHAVDRNVQRQCCQKDRYPTYFLLTYLLTYKVQSGMMHDYDLTNLASSEVVTLGVVHFL